MSLESALDEFPKEIVFKDGFACALRPLEPHDAKAFHEFFLAMPAPELMYIKHRVTELPVVTEWCENIDHGHNLPLLAVRDGKIIGVATLHQQLGGWRRHIGRVSVHVHPQHRGRGLARRLVNELVEISRACGLEKLEAEFIGKQLGALKMFSLIGFSQLVKLPDYVKDMQAVTHDYVLMGLDLVTDEEYAGMG
ncbi:MAG: GNAT family N-acetyltransferase [Verrucomicrobia bacterium]|nr:GNAT family N-acetyltransferase [Verrucomicrobiota bacterium]